jgi:hypothetical protein
MSCHMEKGTVNVNCLLNWGRKNVVYWWITVLGNKYCSAVRMLSVCEANVSEGNKKEAGVYKH